MKYIKLFEEINFDDINFDFDWEEEEEDPDNINVGDRVKMINKDSLISYYTEPTEYIKIMKSTNKIGWEGTVTDILNNSSVDKLIRIQNVWYIASRFIKVY